jgi:hypothetical protein
MKAGLASGSRSPLLFSHASVGVLLVLTAWLGGCKVPEPPSGDDLVPDGGRSLPGLDGLLGAGHGGGEAGRSAIDQPRTDAGAANDGGDGSAGRGGQGGAGAGGSHSDAGSSADAGTGDACIEHVTRTVACGRNDRGDQLQRCLDGTFVNEGGCDDPDVCTDSATRSTACGRNGRGTRPQVCTDGAWLATGTCTDPDDCVDGSTQSIACGVGGAGLQMQDCTAGTWQNVGGCTTGTWDCDPTWYGDTECDCGCGIVDIDCANATSGACEYCASGSCSPPSCETIDPNNNAICSGTIPGWDCDPGWYGDTECDCGCGVVDIDCADATSDACEYCATGSCSPADCSAINAGNNGVCDVPGWDCNPTWYGDTECDCGCGIVDIDCANATSGACEYCASGSCSPPDCSEIAPSNNAVCAGDTVPGWTCDPSWYGDTECDCGCGIVDIDCSSASWSVCEACAPGSCSPSDCLSIDATNNAVCVTDAPAGWTCPVGLYGSGWCDCGCGVVDSDCADATWGSCEQCGGDSCSTTDCYAVNPTNNAVCVDAPPGWTCAAGLYGTGYCDCGCGVLDSDCADASWGSCENCDPTSCSTADCYAIDLNDNALCVDAPAGWTCAPALYGTGLCDCGCGVPDSDCTGSSWAACESCDAGSCSTSDCWSINASDNTQCVTNAPAGWTCAPGLYGTGWCDCGCGVHDPDCATSSGSECEMCDMGSCAGTNCATINLNDNAVCTGGVPVTWSCDPSYYDARDGCDCGCGVHDPDCDAAGQTLYGCAAGQTCNAQGRCQ